ncbi:MAG: Ig-like domain-containing protein [Planctomycetes bacterium]|nr:Ig-like domain-containing protein [Planctomycetota bacterium]
MWGQASDDLGVALVRLLIDGSPVATTSTPMFAFAWDTRSASRGPHTLRVEAVDAAGNVGSFDVPVVVTN